MLCVFLFAAAQNLLVPKYSTSLHEGAMVAEYYSAKHENDVLFVGDCEVYENYSTVALWEEYGIRSYIRGGPQQMVWQSYFLLEDALRYETPKVVVFNVLAMKDGAPESEAYNRLNIDGMRLSGSKARAVSASMTPGESALSYYFPLLRYHDRWKELGADDFAYYFKRAKTTHNGYVMRSGVKPTGVVPDAPKLKDYAFSADNYAWLDRMAALCERKGIALVLVKAPSIYPYWYPEWDERMARYAQAHGLLYLNFSELQGETGIDFTTDTYDAGLHLNRVGAEKLSAYLGGVLRERFGLADFRGDARACETWNVIARDYEAMARAQETEILEYGEERTFVY